MSCKNPLVLSFNNHKEEVLFVHYYSNRIEPSDIHRGGYVASPSGVKGERTARCLRGWAVYIFPTDHVGRRSFFKELRKNINAYREFFEYKFDPSTRLKQVNDRAVSDADTNLLCSAFNKTLAKFNMSYGVKK